MKKTILIFLMATSCTSINAQSVIRAFSQVYSDNIKGGITLLGNTNVHIVDNNQVNLTKMNETGNASNSSGGLGYSQYGNNNANMQYVDVDGVSATKNSSSADLILPAGTNVIKFARLYWSGRINNSVITARPDTLSKIKIRKGTGPYIDITTPSINVSTQTDQFVTAGKLYQAFFDITSFINSGGSGTYTVADIPLTTGNSTGGQYGAWAIVVAYENLSQPYNSVRVYDGYAQVYNSGSISYLNINLTGLNVPSSTLSASDAVMGTIVWEGDADLGTTNSNPAGDYIKINNTTVSNTVNPAANFWNGSISKNGAFVHTKNPDYTNQMGIDIDEVNVGTGYGIMPNATSVGVQFGTEADQYFPSVFTFCIRVKDPLLSLDKIVSDSSGNGFAEVNEVLTYTLFGTNQGNASSTNSVVVDTLPLNVTYIPNTLELVSSPGLNSGSMTDLQDLDNASVSTYNGKQYIKFFIGNGSNNNTGGSLSVGSSYSIRFKVRASSVPGTIINTARVYSTNQMNEAFTDDGTAIISPSSILPITLISFNADLIENNKALVKWVTTSEIDNDYFIVERSSDGINFMSRSRVKGYGTTSSVSEYKFVDELDNKSSVFYYRIKIVSTTGVVSYSSVVRVKKQSISSLSVYPNPFISDIKIHVSSSCATESNIKIFSSTGSYVINKTVNLTKGDNYITINSLLPLQSGTYLIKFSTADGNFTKTITK